MSRLDMRYILTVQFPGIHIVKDNEVDYIGGPENDDNLNIEAAEAEKNCDLAEVPVAIGRELDKQNNKVIKEADINDPDQIDHLEPKDQPGIWNQK